MKRTLPIVTLLLIFPVQLALGQAPAPSGPIISEVPGAAPLCGPRIDSAFHQGLIDPEGYHRNLQRFSANAFGTDKFRGKKSKDHCGGTIVKYTREKGRDTRIFSQLLCQKRDLYVYLPPGYDPSKCYPFVLFLHGAFGDEHAFLSGNVLNTYDRWVMEGKAMPMIIACPDGTNDGSSKFTSQHSFYVNGNAGRFEDHLMQEVIPFLTSTYSIRTEREAHAICGVSAGAYGGLYLSLKYPEYFATACMLAPPANIRYWNCKDRYFRNFDPEEYRWQTRYRPNLIVGNFHLFTLRARRLLNKTFGPNEEVFDKILVTNPADVLFQVDLSKYPVDFYINCPSHDNFNFDAQSKSFQWLANSKGIDVKLEIEPFSQHLPNYFNRLMPVIYYQVSRKLTPAAPCECLIGKTWNDQQSATK